MPKPDFTMGKLYLLGRYPNYHNTMLNIARYRTRYIALLYLTQTQYHLTTENNPVHCNDAFSTLFYAILLITVILRYLMLYF